MRIFPEVVVFEHANFQGAEKRTNLNLSYVGDFWNDKISSIIVISGTWRFFQHANYQGAYWDLGPGYYSWVEAVNIPNDIISSMYVVSWNPQGD
jgi:Beta/Gamma crystallin